MNLFARIVLWTGGLGFLAFGAAFLFNPLGTIAATGIELTGHLAATELRAMYGGLELGIGALLIAAALRAQHLRAGLWLCLGSYGGIGGGRLLGMVITGTSTAFLWTALCSELVLATAAGVALLRRA